MMTDNEPDQAGTEALQDESDEHMGRQGVYVVGGRDEGTTLSKRASHTPWLASSAGLTDWALAAYMPATQVLQVHAARLSTYTTRRVSAHIGGWRLGACIITTLEYIMHTDHTYLHGCSGLRLLHYNHSHTQG